MPRSCLAYYPPARPPRPLTWAGGQTREKRQSERPRPHAKGGSGETSGGQYPAERRRNASPKDRLYRAGDTSVGCAGGCGGAWGPNRALPSAKERCNRRTVGAVMQQGSAQSCRFIALPLPAPRRIDFYLSGDGSGRAQVCLWLGVLLGPPGFSRRDGSKRKEMWVPAVALREISGDQRSPLP